MVILQPNFGLIPDSITVVRVMFPAVVFLALQASVALASPLEDQDRFFDLCEKITAISTKNGKGWIHPIKDWLCGTTTTVPTTTTTSTAETTSVAPPSSGSCFAIGVHAKQTGMNDWCHLNCNHVPAYYPPTHCRCTNNNRDLGHGIIDHIKDWIYGTTTTTTTTTTTPTTTQHWIYDLVDLLE